MALCWSPEGTSSATREAVTGSKDLGLYHDCAQLGEELPAHSGAEGQACRAEGTSGLTRQSGPHPTYLRFSSLMELRMNAGFRAREMGMRS